MPDLKLTGRTVRASPTLEVLVEEIEGSIDAATTRTFENALHQVLDAGHRNIVFVFSNVASVNSSGMGALIQCADRVRAAGGEICLVNVNKEVLSLLEMLGLLPILPVYSTEAEAIAYLGERAGAPQTAPGGETEATTAVGEEAPGSPPGPTAEEAGDASAGPTAEEGGAAPDELYPLELTCPDCQNDLEIRQQGYHRCPSCSCYFVAEGDGKVQAVRLDDSKVAEFRLPAEDPLGPGIRQVTSSLVEGLGYPAEVTSGIDQCLERAWHWATQAATGVGVQLRLFVAASADEWVAGIVIPGGTSGEAVGIGELKGLADQVELTPMAAGGQMLRICIKVGVEGEAR